MNESYRWELAISYANKDKKIVDRFAERFENIFFNRFFQDTIHTYVFSKANNFKEMLRELYGNEARRAVVFYSANYPKGNFAPTEFAEIISQKEQNKDFIFFIINIDRSEIEHDEAKHLFYHDFDSTQNTQDQDTQIDEIVSSIKGRLIEESVQKNATRYRLGIQSIFVGQNTPDWINKNNWNIITKQHIQNDGRRLVPESSWKALWQEVKSGYLSIHDCLKLLETRPRLELILNCHLSLAYALGQTYGPIDERSSGSGLTLRSFSKDGPAFDFDQVPEGKVSGPKFHFDDFHVTPGNDPNSKNYVCAILIT